MSDFDANPFADPFKDGSVTQAADHKSSDLENYNPFSGSTSGGIEENQPAVMQPSNPPPYNNYGSNNEKSAPPVIAPAAPAPVPGHEELLRRQEELEKKAEELQRREQQMASGNYNPKANNWPPLPKWFPCSPCFYQDFSVDIPLEFQGTVKFIYYLWMYFIIVMFVNMLVSLIVFTQDGSAGVGFGLSILWLLAAPCALCWYRPVYKAFRSDSSFNFFLFFFIMFFQVCVSILMTVGITNSGYSGLIVALSHFDPKLGGPWVGILVIVQTVLFGVMALLSAFLLKKVHSLYRTTGASFEKAQQEFATGVMKNPGVQTAAANAATTAVQSSLRGQY